MPVVSQFYGIIIKMYFLSKEHNPPHIHVIYGENNAIIEIETAKVLEGSIPLRALKIVKEWIILHQRELLEIWNTQKFKKIEPLI